jgi:hypothetical protein
MMSLMTQAIQRRSSPRNKLSSLVHVRPSEAGLVIPESVCPTENSSREGIYFIAEKYTIRQRVQVFLSFPNNFDPAAIFREYLAEVVRLDSLPQGRCGVAARLLNHIQLRLCDGLIVPETGFWQSWPPAAPARLNFYA